MEILSCGKPVEAFGVDGNADMIERKVNGYLTNPFDTADLAVGIEWVLNAVNYSELSANARAKVLRDFDSKVVAGRYVRLYREIL